MTSEELFGHLTEKTNVSVDVIKGYAEHFNKGKEGGKASVSKDEFIKGMKVCTVFLLVREKKR